MANSTHKVGQVVELIDGRHATVRFVGTTSFADGDWIGVELSEASGKNDGSVKGQRYFDCDPEHGLFMRSTSIKAIIQSPTPKARAAPAATTSKKTVPGSRQSTVNGQKPAASDSATKRRQTLNASSPSPAPRTSVAAAGRKSPSKLAARTPATSTSTTTSRTAASSTTARKPATATTTAASRLSTSRTGATSSTPSRASASTTTAATRTARPSVGGAAVSAKKPTSTTTSRPSSMVAARPSRVSSITSKPNGVAQHSRNTSMASSVKSQPISEVASSPEEKKEEDSDKDEAENDDRHDDDQVSKDDETAAEDKANGTEDESGEEQEQGVAKDEAGHAEQPKTNGAAKRPQPPPAATRAPARTPAKAVAVAPSNRQVMELEAKVKAGEKQVEEYKEQLKALEKIKADRDRFEGIIQRLQAKYQPQQQELTELRKKLKDVEQKLEENEGVLAGHDEDMEMATLDREMAEETAESLRAELREIQVKLEELQLENEVLKDENAEYTREMSPEERTSQGWLQKERENDRLREALIRLRDMTQDREAELNERITELENESQQLSGVSEEYEQLKEKLKQAESAVEDLKAQLETATGAEDMIEDLTNQNLTLSDQIKDLNGTIDYLEALKELNDDLEASHLDAEKQMQDEIDYKDAVLIEQVRFNLQQKEKMTDYEYTINKFREVVSNLQEHITEMQKSQEISDKDAEALTARSKAMTDLNMKLQTSVAKTQSNTLDLELRRMEAQEAVEHLAITQMFLPEGFESERKAVSSYLRFKRVAAKARLLHQTLRDKIVGNLPIHAHENAFAMCDVADKLVWIAATCDRFVNNISSCPADRFMSYAAALNELEPVEKTINGYIEVQKRGDLKLNEVSEELQRLTALLAHLAEVHIPQDSVEAFADDIIMRSVLIQSYLENTAAALVLARNLVPESEHEDDAEQVDGLTEFQSKAENMAGQLRSIKVVVGKAIHSLEELRARSMALRHDLAEPFEQFQHSSSRLAASARQLGEHVRNAVEDNSGESDSTRDAIRAALSTFCLTVLGDNSTSDPLASLNPKISIASTQANGLLSLSGDLSKAVEFERLQPPWAIRADQVKNSKMSSLRAEDEVRRLKEEIAGHLNQLQARSQILEEQNVKIELLESRTKDVNSKTNRITELQRIVETSKVRERELIGAMEKQIQDNQTLLIERDRWKQTAAEQKPVAGVKESVQATEHATVSSIEMDALKLEIEGLKGAVRYFNTDKDNSMFSSLSLAYNPWLEQPLVRKPTTQQIDRANLRKRGSDVLTDLLDLAGNARWIDLSTMPEDKLAWRPAKQQPRWQILREREKWQAWRSRRDAILEGAEVVA